MARTKPEPVQQAAAPADPMPTHGGCYTRLPDGTLVLDQGPDDHPMRAAAPEAVAAVDALEATPGEQQ